MEPEAGADVHGSMRRLNPTVLALLAGVVLLLLLVVYFASSRNPDQDKLKNAQIAATQAGAAEKRCASQSTYDLIKRELFRRAALVRGSGQPAFDQLASYAVVRMENPVLESEAQDTGAANCSGSLSLDLPPGVAVADGRRSLMADVDYTVQSAADGSGTVVVLRNADAIITPLATLTKVGGAEQPSAQEADTNTVAPADSTTSPPQQPVAPTSPSQVPARPGQDCADARTRGESALCSDAGLSALNRNMESQYSRALSVASPEQQLLLRRTGDRFLAYRDRCLDNRCIGDAYVGRMREIRDIMEGRWQPPR